MLSHKLQREFAETEAFTQAIPLIMAFKPISVNQEKAFTTRKHQLIIGGGNKSGKTYISVAKATYRSVPEKDINGQNTGWLLDPYIRLKIPIGRRIQGWFSCYTQSVQLETIQPEVDKFFLPFIKDSYKEKGVYHHIHTEIADIHFQWQKSDPISYTGANLDFAALDEPHDRQIYYETASRFAKTKGYMWTALTPVIDAKDPDAARKARYIRWMKEELIDPFHNDPKSVPQVEVIYVDITENPHVEADFAMEMWASMSAEERMIRKTGMFEDFIGKSAFDAEQLKKLEAFLQTTPEVSEPEYGLLEYDDMETDKPFRVKFIQTIDTFPDEPKTGWIWKIWQRPLREQLGISPEYAIGADAAEGKKGNDYTAVYVVRVDTGEIVAALHGYIDEIELARQLAMAGRYYGKETGYLDDETMELTPAKIAIEVVSIGKTTQAYLLTGHKELDIPKYPMSQIYRRPGNTMLDGGLVIPGGDFGWYTSNASRPHLITIMRQLLAASVHAIDNHAIDNGGVIPIKDKGWVREAKRFILSAQGKYEAAPTKFDDKLFASAITTKVVEQIRKLARSRAAQAETLIPKERFYYDEDGVLIFNMAGETKHSRGLKQPVEMIY